MFFIHKTNVYKELKRKFQYKKFTKIQMTDTWKFTLPEDKVCWDDLKEYAPADTACATALTTAADLKMSAALKEGEFKADGSTSTGYMLKTCAADKMVLHAGADATAAAADGAVATTVTYGDKLKDGVVTCA
jgi:3-methyladenine DNA glycosylase Tag